MTWWVESIERTYGPPAFDWTSPECFVVRVRYDHARMGRGRWPLQVDGQAVTSWCTSNCASEWRVGQLDEIYFADEGEALLFMMTHGKHA